MMEGRSSEEGSKEELVSETSECGINNIKRMKIDEEEKNIRMQARLKVSGILVTVIKNKYFHYLA